MRALVLGGSRFLGPRLVQELVRHGHAVDALNRGTTPAEFPEGVGRLYADRQEPQQVASALSGREYDVVYDVSGLAPPETQTTMELLTGRVGHYIYVSTSAVYERRWTAPVTEDFPYNQVEGLAYGRNKAATELVLFKAYRESGFPVSVVRPWMVFGPGNSIPSREQLVFFRVQLGRPVFLPYNGYIHIQYGHVQDLARAMVMMAGNSRCIGQVYNITGPDAITLNGYLQMIASLMGRDVQVVYLDYADVLEEAGNYRELLPFPWQYSRIASVDKAREHFGFWPEYDSRLCTEDSLRWYLAELAGSMQYDFSREDALLVRYGDSVRRAVITPGGDMPEVVR